MVEVTPCVEGIVTPRRRPWWRRGGWPGSVEPVEQGVCDIVPVNELLFDNRTIVRYPPKRGVRKLQRARRGWSVNGVLQPDRPVVRAGTKALRSRAEPDRQDREEGCRPSR